MKPVKVLEVIRQGEIGGGESHVLDLVAGFDKDKVNPIIMAFTDGHMIETLKQEGFTCYVVETRKAFDLSVQKKIIDIIKKEGIQLIHAHGSRAASNMLWTIDKLKLPMIYTVHGWSFHQDQNPFIHYLRALSEKLICSKSKQVICVSESNRQSGIKSFGLKNNCQVIENGINLAKFNADRQLADIRKELGIPQEEFIIGFVGRITLQKAPYDFIDGVVAAHSINPQIKGLLVGEGDMKAEITDYINKNGWSKCFYQSDFRTDIPEVLHAMNIFCLPSLWEGLSIALLEAMAMKKAIVVTPTDGTREIIKDNENGTIVPYHSPMQLSNAFIEYEKHPERIKEHGINALNIIKQRFNSLRVSQAVTCIYQQTLS